MAAEFNRSMMDMAHKSVRRKVFSIFDNYWIAGGVMVGVVLMIVFLMRVVPQQPEDTHMPRQGSVASSIENRVVLEETARHNGVLSNDSISVEKSNKEQAVPKPRFEFYETLPKMEVVIPVEEPLTLVRPMPTPAKEEPVGPVSTGPTDAYYLQAGSFRDKELADKLKTKLAGLGFKSEIHEVRINKTDVYYRVHVGPFANFESIENSKQKLGELRIEARIVKAGIN